MHPPGTRKAGGTHPTAMLSCYEYDMIISENVPVLLPGSFTAPVPGLYLFDIVCEDHRTSVGTDVHHEERRTAVLC